MGIMVYSLLWVMQDSYHQPYHVEPGGFGGRSRDGELPPIGLLASRLKVRKRPG